MREYIGSAVLLGERPIDKLAIFWRQTKNLRTRLKLAAYHPDAVFRLRTTYGPLYVRDNFGDITNLVDLFYREVYRVPALGDGSAILDIGANIGLAAAALAWRHPGHPIYCVEPLAANARLIPLNCPNAVVEQIAVGATRGRVRLSVDADEIMASAIPCAWQTTEREFDVVPLDDLVRRHGLHRIGLIKIDAEGMEMDVLQGATDALSVTERVVMETHGRGMHHGSAGFLSSAGFTIDFEAFNGVTGLIRASSGRAVTGSV
ncbi:MAG: FkbM family methyltransferase [Acidobacteria bacterium]|nr:FkbM family methyltransferase [Acidobacteriota bacterium]